RRLVRYPIRFTSRGVAGSRAGHAAQTPRMAATENLSETGLFIATRDPLPSGSRLDIDLKLPGLTAHLEAVVVWTCAQNGEGRKPGMGVGLIEPPPAYRALVRSL